MAETLGPLTRPTVTESPALAEGESSRRTHKLGYMFDMTSSRPAETCRAKTAQPMTAIHLPCSRPLDAAIDGNAMIPQIRPATESRLPTGTMMIVGILVIAIAKDAIVY
jgi:hypothetical protein